MATHEKSRKKCKNCACNFTQPESRGKPKQLKDEVDEMHTYVGNKKTVWIWIAIERNGKKFIDF